jgi:hypothetical protein
MGRKKIIKEVIAEILPSSDIQPEPQIEPINEPIELKPIKEPLQLINPDDMDSDTDSLIVANKKRILSDKTKDALKKGRDKLAEKWIQDRERNEELKSKYAIKKANKIIKEKLKIKKEMGVEDLDSEDEEPIKIIQPKKAKKQQVIVLPTESDSEDEIIIKKDKKIKKVVEQKIEPIKTKPNIVFY